MLHFLDRDPRRHLQSDPYRLRRFAVGAENSDTVTRTGHDDATQLIVAYHRISAWTPAKQHRCSILIQRHLGLHAGGRHRTQRRLEHLQRPISNGRTQRDEQQEACKQWQTLHFISLSWNFTQFCISPVSTISIIEPTD
jgi:hypothetical protein